MRWWAFALFFAVVGAVSGMSNYMMEDMGYDNWYDQPGHDMQIIDISESDIETLEPGTNNPNPVSDSVNTWKYLSIFYSVLKGILLITSMLDDWLVYDVAGVNLFAPVLASFQILVWAIYIMGFTQVVLRISAKGME